MSQSDSWQDKIRQDQQIFIGETYRPEIVLNA